MPFPKGAGPDLAAMSSTLRAIPGWKLIDRNRTARRAKPACQRLRNPPCYGILCTFLVKFCETLPSPLLLFLWGTLPRLRFRLRCRWTDHGLWLNRAHDKTQLQLLSLTDLLFPLSSVLFVPRVHPVLFQQESRHDRAQALDTAAAFTPAFSFYCGFWLRELPGVFELAGFSTLSGCAMFRWGRLGEAGLSFEDLCREFLGEYYVKGRWWFIVCWF